MWELDLLPNTHGAGARGGPLEVEGDWMVEVLHVACVQHITYSGKIDVAVSWADKDGK